MDVDLGERTEATRQSRAASAPSRAIASLTGALGFSINAVFGKLALKHLDATKLARQASAFGFDAPRRGTTTK